MLRSPLVLLLLLAPVVARAADSAPLPGGLYAEFTTPRGTFIAHLFHDKTPMTCASFVGLAEGTIAPRGGQPYYTGLNWYRVVPNFVIQSGDPANPGDGLQERPRPGQNPPSDGHPDSSFPDEFVPGLHHDAAGVLSMANGGPDTNSREFFLTLRETSRLNYLHSVFGRVVRELDVLPQIQPGDAFAIKILRIGAAAQAFKADPAAFAALKARAVPYAAAKEPGPQTHFDDPDRLLPAEPPRARNFNFKLANFERATGLRVYARVLAKLPEPAPNARKTTPAGYAQKLARDLGLTKSGVLAVHVADRGEWYLWVGDTLLPAFNPEKKRLLDRKREFYVAVKAQAAVYTGEARTARGPDNPLKPADLVKYSVDAMLDALILQFEPKSKP